MKRLVVPVAALAFALAACGNDGGGHENHSGQSTPGVQSTPSVQASDTVFNPQDVMFAQGMVPHHQQALEMAALAGTRAKSPKVKDLAKQIEGAQDPEIKLMSGWLKDWGYTVPGADGDHSGHGGMMTPAEMEQLEKSSGAAVDKQFLELMIKHHEGAVTSSQTELQQGKYQPAKDLAAAIIKGQTAEIKTMKALLG